MCTISKVIGINKGEICLPNKEYISGHRWERISMVVKCLVHIHITVHLKPSDFLLVKQMFLTSISKLFNLRYLSGSFQLTVGCFSIDLLALVVCCDVLAFSTMFSASLAVIITALLAAVAACVTACIMLFRYHFLFLFCAFLQICLWWDCLYWVCLVLFFFCFFFNSAFCETSLLVTLWKVIHIEGWLCHW